jgi:calcium/calmodulin-dependent protein kinase I
MAFAFSSALQPPVRAAAAPSQSVLEPPRPRLDTVTAALNSAFASFAGFSVPRFAVEERTQLPVAREVPKAAASDGAQDLSASLDWPDHFREAYKIGRTYGHGAFGTIRLARHRLTGESVAIKVLSKSRPQQTRARTVGKLLREAECLARVQSCDNVVSLRGIFEDSSSAYLVMDHCSGGDLEQLLERHGPLQEHQVAAVLWEVLKVVSACHAAGVCHGDIKPANFLLARKLPRSLHLVPAGARPDDGPWLIAIDFGCAQLAPPMKKLSRRTGTPVYMAPEVFQRKYTRAADLWSVGMMAYHLLSGHFPFWCGPPADALQARPAMDRQLPFCRDVHRSFLG